MDNKRFTSKVLNAQGPQTRNFAVDVIARFGPAVERMIGETGVSWDATYRGPTSRVYFIRAARPVRASDVREAVWEQTGGVGSVRVDKLSEAKYRRAVENYGGALPW